MSIAIQELEEKRKYTLEQIEYIGASIEKYNTNEGKLDEGYCKGQIDVLEHSLIGYRRELYEIESQLGPLRH